MWLGERITEKGIGNGISMLIMIGIVSRFPGALVAEFLSRGTSQALFFVLELVVLFAIVMGVILLDSRRKTYSCTICQASYRRKNI